MNPVLFVAAAILPVVGIPLLLAFAMGAPVPRPKPTARNLVLLAVALWASLRAYVAADEKPQPPEPPKPPPGPYVPGGAWETILHRDPFTGALEIRREYRLPPSVPEVPVEKQ